MAGNFTDIIRSKLEAKKKKTAENKAAGKTGWDFIDVPKAQKEAEARLAAQTGFAPSEATEEELEAHRSDPAKLASQMAIKKTISKPPLFGAMDANGAPRSATAGTTPKGMQPVSYVQPQKINFTGSGPSPAAAQKAAMSIRKKSKLFNK